MRNKIRSMPFLYLVATPIGNLEDISLRALKILKEVDFILCEDTRRTRKLLDHFKIKTPLISYHQHSSPRKINQILGWLKQGKNLAMVSDAGTPGIADPGGKLIEQIKQRFDSKKIILSPIPGPSAITTALSVSGVPLNRFLFLGFPPTKKKRKEFLKEVLTSKYPVIFFESPHRIIKTLTELTAIYQKETKSNCPKPQQTEVLEMIVCRELTKLNEQIIWGSPYEIIEKLKKEKPEKGEYTVIINPHKKIKTRNQNFFFN